ncbi:hypothetical protein BSNK01_19800 [Bacillaceae bacterium]
MNLLLKDWKEVYRSKTYWLTSGMIVLFSLLILRQFVHLNTDIYFSAALMPLFRINLYIIPFIAMVVASFSVLQEKSQRTLPVLLANYFSPLRFLLEKSLSVHMILTGVILSSYFFVLLFSRFCLKTDFFPFMIFLLSILLLSVIFAQIGICLGVLMDHKLPAFAGSLTVWAFFLFFYDLVLIYAIPGIEADELLAFSVFYFFSPIHAIEYFLSVKLGIYPLAKDSAIFNHFAFESPGLVLAANLLFWLGLSVSLSYIALKSRGVRT